MHRPSPTTHGFTLLEMATVLAIIGLLAGVVVAGRSYVQQATINSLAVDAQYYRNAFNQFEQKYGMPPGDMATASAVWPYAGNGDGNGFIGLSGNNAEYFYTFQHLANAGLIEGLYTGAAGSGGAAHAVPGSNVPAGQLVGSGFVFRDISTDYVTSDATFFNGLYQKPLMLGAATTSGLPNSPLLTSKEAAQLDDKFDDGRPSQGNLRAPISTSLAACTTTAVVATAVYNTGSTGPACWLVFTQP